MELREWCREIIENLGQLLSAPKDEQVRRFRVLGRMRCEENIPLPEVILRALILKNKITEFIRGQGFPVTALQLYTEHELELRIDRFFDGVVYNLVRGYEDAKTLAARVA